MAFEDCRCRLQRRQSYLRASFPPSRAPGDHRSPAGRAEAWPCESQRRSLSAHSLLPARSVFLCSPEAHQCSRRPKLSPQEAMAKSRGRLYLWMCLAAALASFLVGFMVAWFIKPLKEITTCMRYHQSIRWELVSEMKAENIKSFLRSFTKLPHLAGTEQNFLLANKIQTQWKKSGLDSPKLVHYDVLLSYPNETNANCISIVDEHETVIFKTSYLEPPPDGYENVTDIVPPYNAFSAQGMPEGNLVYVNYALTEDFFKLEREMGIHCTGKIVIARYGKIFRGNKVKNAMLAVAIGIILYSDPADYFAPEVQPYPKGWNLPGTAAQRGNVLNLNGAGDPLTPGYPAKEFRNADPHTQSNAAFNK
ncbi:N-acetylated-alpha-linked acidic dipeptidase 2-like [Symphalangus syndactylus]|uniref:N-acetylated-alpha-linked acidic dipeptidase 2-like n=1 Tax=Symphalangus syndactylus TaxID=9590 RepID=UPI003004D749